MKKLIALLLALVMVIGLVACGNNNETPEVPENNDNAQTPETPETPEVPEEPVVTGPATALELLETVWGLYGEDEKFFVFGGDGMNMVDGAPGAYTDMEALQSQLLVPAEEQDKVSEIASLFHGMMLNNFTCGAFKMAEGVDAAAFADTLYTAVTGNQWMCGFPEKVMIAVVGDYVVMVFGLTDVVDTFQAKLTEAYSNTEVKYAEALA